MPGNTDDKFIATERDPRARLTRRDAIRSISAGALAAGLGVPPAAAQMAQGHREVRPGTPPLAGVRVIERTNLLSGRLAGLLLADQGAEVFVERAGPTTVADQGVALDDAYFDRGKIALPKGVEADLASADIVILDGAAPFSRAPHQILVRIVAALPGDEAYGHLPDNCSEDLINAICASSANMSISGPIFQIGMMYTPIPLPSHLLQRQRLRGGHCGAHRQGAHGPGRRSLRAASPATFGDWRAEHRVQRAPPISSNLSW